VFSDERERKALERIIHPYVIKEAAARAARLPGREPVILDAPLLYEAGLDQSMDKVIVVWSTEKQQLKRLSKRDRLDGLEASLRICAQLPIGIKKKKADFVVDNSGSLAAAKRDIKKIWEVLTKKSK
jgi:dephospho-CoA kinase